MSAQSIDALRTLAGMHRLPSDHHIRVEISTDLQVCARGSGGRERCHVPTLKGNQRSLGSDARAVEEEGAGERGRGLDLLMGGG